jgi:hypothetical protein
VTVPETFDYKLVTQDQRPRRVDEHPHDQLLQLLQANGSAGWEFDRLLPSPEGDTNLYVLFKQRTISG